MTGLKGMVVVMAIPKDETAPTRARLVPVADAKKAAEAAIATGRYAKIIEAVPFRSLTGPK